MPDRELTPEQEAAFERVKARSVRLDPVMVGILNRASELARREQTVTIKEVLEALLHATITPASSITFRPRSITEDERGAEVVYLDDLAVLAAQLVDGSLVWQILDRHVDDMDALVTEVRRHVREDPATP
jgi:hypothetical protein